MARPGLILDRDGTLIHFVRDAELGSVVSAFHPEQLRLMPGVLPALWTLQEAGYVLAMATNQPDAAKGHVPPAAIERTNRALAELLASEGVPLAGYEICLHHPVGLPGGDESLIRPCDCRKPAPGMLLKLAGRLDLDVRRSWMIGDTAADAGAAAAAGMRCGLLTPERRCELCPLVDIPPPIKPDLRRASFEELARAIIASSPPVR